MRLAYLCNLYPAVSHSFVRREIEGIERAGYQVQRFSLRPPRDDLKEAADRREAELTECVLGQGMITLAVAAIALAVSRPIKTLRALRAAFKLSSAGVKSTLLHIAYWLEAAWLLRRMERLKIDHLHAHFGTNPAAVAAIIRAWGGPPFSFTAHGPDEFDAPRSLSLTEKIDAASFVVAISSFGRSQLVRWCDPAQWSKIKVVRCGVDAAFLEAAASPVPADSTEFVCVARLSAQKGLPLLLSAAERLKAGGEDFHLTIIGDGELRGSLEDSIRRGGLDDRVTLAGSRSSDEIREYLKSARAFVLPSFAEGLPVVLMEGLAMSRPVIATAIAGIPELVDDQCGWLIPAGSEEALVNAMRDALKASSKELARKSEAGRERVHRLHDAGRNSLELLEIIKASSRQLPTA